MTNNLFNYYKDALYRAHKNLRQPSEDDESIGMAHFMHLKEVRPDLASIIENTIFNPSKEESCTSHKFERFCLLIEKGWHENLEIVKEQIDFYEEVVKRNKAKGYMVGLVRYGIGDTE